MRHNVQRHLYTGVPTSRETGDTLMPERSAPDSTATSDVTRRAHRPRNGPPKRTAAFDNHILLQLPPADRDALLAEAEYVSLEVGQKFARAGDPIRWAYFPDTGVISLVSEMTTGHQVAVAAIGEEGVVGLGVLFEMPVYTHNLVVLIESRGFQITAARFHRVFQQSETLRRIVLDHVGIRMRELTTAAACNRVHSHRQRLARWLLMTTDKAKQQSLPVTHEALAQIVGGPRHAVTVALNELRVRGAIAHLRGRIDVIERSVLIAQSCECYTPPV
jgi:CRP-like cAMP-binding protein